MLFSSRSRVLWGEAAIEAYQAAKNGPTTLWHEPDITQILDLLDSKLLLQSAKHFPQRKPLQVKTVWVFCHIKRKNRSLCLIARSYPVCSSVRSAKICNCQIFYLRISISFHVEIRTPLNADMSYFFSLV